ncbi:hypothetical protein Vi05172_g10915 [Venturia inaequalis]|nr:hypothetical protein Vi05172_g10915 [Venturia inaequalis]
MISSPASTTPYPATQSNINNFPIFLNTGLNIRKRTEQRQRDDRRRGDQEGGLDAFPNDTQDGDLGSNLDLGQDGRQDDSPYRSLDDTESTLQPTGQLTD